MFGIMELSPYTTEEEVAAPPTDELLMSEAFLASWLKRKEAFLPSHRLSGEIWRSIFRAIFYQDSLDKPEINETPNAVLEKVIDAAEHDEPIEAELELSHERKDASTMTTSQMNALVNSKLEAGEEPAKQSNTQPPQSQYQPYNEPIMTSARQKKQSIATGIIIAILLIAIAIAINALLNQ